MIPVDHIFLQKLFIIRFLAYNIFTLIPSPPISSSLHQCSHLCLSPFSLSLQVEVIFKMRLCILKIRFSIVIEGVSYITLCCFSIPLPPPVLSSRHLIFHLHPASDVFLFENQNLLFQRKFRITFLNMLN